MNRCDRLVLWIVVLVSLTGCGDDGRVPTYEVQGKVVFKDGSPLQGGSVICLSDSTEHSMSARGNIAEDGTFTLGTYESDDGAIAGKHLVAIDPPLPTGFNPDAGPAPRVIHPRFQQHDSSGLEFVVTDDGPNEVTLEVSRK